jgi:hypothetical protein
MTGSQSHWNCPLIYTFLNQRFKNAAIEQVEFTFGEGSIANRFIESYLRSRSHTLLSRFFINQKFLIFFPKSIDLPPCGRFIFQVKARPSLNKKAATLIRKICNLIRNANLIQKYKI